ncbi:MAG: phospho-sugar mutase [Streptosporangiaceae bacterium]
MSAEPLRARAAAWLAEDPDEADRAELAWLLADDSPEATAELADRFARRLSFGTAGLRGAIGAGPNRMNRATVTAATAGLASWLLGRDPAAADAGVVVGCDARYRSEEFAAQAARVLAAAGIRVHLLASHQPTPLLAYAVRYFQAAAGVMITASHNPPGDNGYKLYLGDGAQIAPPADTDVETAIAAVGSPGAVPVAAADSPLISRADDGVAQAYLDTICAELGPAPAHSAWLRLVYTPLHGVAGELALRAFEQAGYPQPDLVAAQFDPDPGFPTVRFPNPEEPGALDLALAEARRSGADLVIANDPDGDRLAVAIPDQAAPGGYRQLTGDQLGAVLGSFVLGRVAADPGVRMPDQLVVSTVVSGSLLSKIAVAAGAPYAQTLTGFKWIVRAADLRPGARFCYGYEEALGYAVTGAVRDKDGISAALAVLAVAATARSAGQSLQDCYDRLEEAHGVHVTAQLSVPAETAIDVMSRLRAAPPGDLDGEPVVATTDYTGGSDLPSADMLGYRLPGARVVIRPSGTEPMIRAYLEVVELATGRTLAAARQAADERMSRLRTSVAELLA